MSRFKLWFGLLGGAVAWLAHLMLAYAIAEFGCLGGLGHVYFLGITVVAWLVIVVSVATLLVAVVSTLVAYRCERRLRVGPAIEDRAGEADVARAGWITSGLSALVIFVESLPIFYYLHHC